MTVARTCRLFTLGCKVNQYETQYVKEMLELNGYVEADDGRPADLCVVNTCTVTGTGDATCRTYFAPMAALSQPASELRSASTNSISDPFWAMLPMLARTALVFALLLIEVRTHQPSFSS